MNNADNTLNTTQHLILKMLKNSQTKVIFPIMTFALLRDFITTGKDSFSESEIRNSYYNSVRYFESYLGHNMHIGGKFYDAYPIRNLPRYNVLHGCNSKLRPVFLSLR